MGEYGGMEMAQTRWRYAVAGVLTGFTGLAVGTAVAWLLRTRSTPVVAVAEGVRDLVPGPLATWLVHLVGRFDKPLLIAGVVSFVLLVAMGAGLLARRFPLWSDVILFIVAGIGIVAAARAGGAASAGAVLIGFVAMVITLRWLVASPREVAAGGADSRRTFLKRSVLVAAGGAIALAVGRVAGRSRRIAEESRRLVRLPGGRGSVPQGASLGVEGQPPWRTPNGTFYRIDTALAPPVVAAGDWELRIHGMVDHEVSITFEELLRFEHTGAWVTLACVSNEVGGDLIGNAWWSGVPVRTLLERAGVLDGADAVLQTSVDGWTCLTPLEVLTDDRNAMLAYAMNGEPLEIEHGFPVRTVVPGLYGYVSATKWVVDLEVTRFDRTEGYWTSRGWSARGPVKTQSRIDVPRSGAQVASGVVPVGGVAWAQHTGIERVEYSLDGGDWRGAGLGRVPNTDTWVQWSGTVDVEPGEHELRVRATDRSGYVQVEERSPVDPDGATGWHTITFKVE